MKKLYIVQLENKNIRTIVSDEPIRVGTIIEKEVWLGQTIKGGKVIKIFK